MTQKFNPDVFGLIQNKLARNKKGLKEMAEKSLNQAVSKIFGFNTVQGVEYVENESVDIIVTSPPYGDSRTTVRFGKTRNPMEGGTCACEKDRNSPRTLHD